LQVLAVRAVVDLRPGGEGLPDIYWPRLTLAQLAVLVPGHKLLTGSDMGTARE
jgi:hypothetical protein